MSNYFTLEEVKTLPLSHFPVNTPIQVIEIPGQIFCLRPKDKALDTCHFGYRNFMSVWDPSRGKKRFNALMAENDANEVSFMNSIQTDGTTSVLIPCECVNIQTGDSQTLNLYAEATDTATQPPIPKDQVMNMSFITMPNNKSPQNIIFPINMLLKDIIAPNDIATGTLQLWLNGIQTGNFFDLSALHANNSGRPLVNIPLVAGTQIQFVVAAPITIGST